MPNDIPIFDEWEEAAVHALTMPGKAAIAGDLGMTADTRDAAAIATFSEYYNGLGYHNRDTASPYVYSGTDNYDRGKYVSDGKYSSTHRDQQLGVMSMVDRIGGADIDLEADTDGTRAWARVVSGAKVLERGATGKVVELLQQKLRAAGFEAGDDGDFGPTVQGAVKKFQKARGLEVDGAVGPGTAGALG